MTKKQCLGHNLGFSLGVFVRTEANKNIYIKGQIRLCTTLKQQTTTALKNVAKRLHNYNATFKDVIKMNT